MSTVQNKLLSLSSTSPTFRLQVLDFMIAEHLSQVYSTQKQSIGKQGHSYYHVFEGVKTALFRSECFQPCNQSNASE